MHELVRESKQSALFKRLAKDLPDLLRRRPPRPKVAKPRQTQRRLTADQVERLVVQYQAGNDMTMLATRWGLHRASEAGHLRRAGVRLRRQGVPDERLAEAVRLYGEGWSCQRLAKRYRCDDETVRQALLRAGVKLRAPWERTQPRARVTPLLDAVSPIRGRRDWPRRQPRKLFADRGYDHDKCRRPLRARGITPRTARRGIAHGSGLGRHRWVVERILGWLHTSEAPVHPP